MALDPAFLPGRWTHAHEEDDAGTLVFRRGDRAFPPSRGRRSFELLADGTLGSHRPGPDDRSLRGAGRWRLLPDNVLELDDAGGPVRYRVIEASGDRLVLER